MRWLAAPSGTRTRRRALCAFHDLLEDPVATLARVDTEVGGAPFDLDADAVARVRGFVAPELCHGATVQARERGPSAEVVGLVERAVGEPDPSLSRRHFDDAAAAFTTAVAGIDQVALDVSAAP